MPNLGEIASVLSAIEVDILAVLAPELQTQKAKLLASFIVKLITTVRREITDPQAQIGISEARQRIVAPLYRALLHIEGVDQSLLSSLKSMQSPDMRLLSNATKALLGAVEYPNSACDSAWTAIREAVEAEELIVQAEPASRDAGYAESGSGQSKGQTSSTTRPTPISTDALNSYLASHFAEKGYRVARVLPLSGGFSKETHLVEMANHAEHGGDWILRRDLPYSPTRSTVVDEFPLLQALAGSAIPSPRPLWLESGGKFFGTPVMAMERLAGNSDATLWTSEPRVAKEITSAAAELLGQLHCVDTLSLPAMHSAVPGTQGASPRDLVSHMEQFWHELDVEPNPLLEALLAWLRNNAPATVERRVLVHGDFGFHNLLVANGRISGLVDWEFSRIGDAHEDLGSARQFVERIMPWRQFISIYEAAGGVHYDPRLEHYYGILSAMRIGLSLFNVLDALGKGDPRVDSKLAYVGRSYARCYLLDAARMSRASP